MANNPIPVYVFTGFLESGKTKFIKEILADPNFTENEVTALLLCEEGIEEYDEKWLAHYGTALVPVESEDRLTPNILKRIEQKYNPDRIIVEYNGMWKLESLMQAFPARWELYQIITTVDATTFEVYSNNIGPQMFEHITTADMVVFNRCTDALKEMLYIKPEDYGLWYIDATGEPEKYDGKTVRFLAQVYRGKDVPAGSFVPGRFGMVCCADDVTFLGFICRYDRAEELGVRDWVTVTASVTVETLPQYRGEGPVLHAIEVVPAEKAKEDIVYFN